MRDVLYDSATLWVFAVKAHRSSRLVVTFQSLTDTAWTEGFGEAFLMERGVDAIHVIPKSNHWYQYDDVGSALEAIRAASGGYDELLTYGLSMGAFAAINFSQALGADRVIAISPQYSLDHAKAPFEHRWNHYVDGVRFCCDNISSITRPPSKVHVIYDPWCQDRRHVELIARHVPVDHVPIPFAWHPATSVLIETGLLSRLIRDLIGDHLDRPAFARDLREASHRTPSFHAGMAEAAPWSKPDLKVALYRRAVALSPDDGKYSRDLAVLLLRLERYDEALELFERERERDPDYGYLPFYISRALKALGRGDEAIRAAQEAVRLSPGLSLMTRNLEEIVGERAAAGPWRRAVRGLRARVAATLRRAPQAPGP